jgi:hypothetical protein
MGVYLGHSTDSPDANVLCRPRPIDLFRILRCVGLQPLAPLALRVGVFVHHRVTLEGGWGNNHYNRHHDQDIDDDDDDDDYHHHHSPSSSSPPPNHLHHHSSIITTTEPSPHTKTSTVPANQPATCAISRTRVVSGARSLGCCNSTPSSLATNGSKSSSEKLSFDSSARDTIRSCVACERVGYRA